MNIKMLPKGNFVVHPITIEYYRIISYQIVRIIIYIWHMETQVHTSKINLNWKLINND